MISPAQTSTAPATDTVEALVRSLYRLGALQRRIGRHALEGLGGQGFTALGIVHVDGPVRVSEIARRLGVDLSVASRQVAALAASGYVERQADATDGRAQLVLTTEAGAQVLRVAHGRMVDAFTEVVAGWDAADVEALTGALARLRDDFEETEDR